MMAETVTKISGVYYDGKTSAAHERELWIMHDGAAGLYEPATLHASPVTQYTELRISSRLGNTPRYIYFSDGGKFETQDNDAIDRWQKLFDDNSWVGLAHYLESHRRFVLIGVLVVLVALWISFKYVIPAVSTIIADQLPLSVSKHLGESSLEMLDAYIFEPSSLDENRQQQLQSLFQQYFASQIEEYGLALHFRLSEEVGANAFALPSGDLVFTDDIVNLAEEDYELLSVMAHEVGHVSQRHVLRRLVQDSFLVFVLTMVSGDVSSASSIVVAAPTLLLEMAYSRKFEVEADEYSLDFMRSHHIDPVHFSNMMQRMQWQQPIEEKLSSSSPPVDREQQGSSDPFEENIRGVMQGLQHYLSSHPASSQRIETFGKPTIKRQRTEVSKPAD